MAELDANALLDFAGVLDDGREQRGGARVAVVARIGADGTAYVSLPGGVDETPLADTGAALSVGDTVNVRIEGGKLRAVYNASDPAVGASYVAPIAGSARNAERSAVSAENAAMEARKVAETIDQHFFADDNGVHVTEAEGDATTEHNILINSLGILLRKAANNLVSITQSAISFFDGQGNDSSNIVAKFGADGAQIGVHDSHNLKLSSNSMGIYYGWDRLATFTSDANVTDVHFGGSDKAIGVKYSNAEVVDVHTFLQTCYVSDGKIYDGDDNLVPYTLSGFGGVYNVLDEDGDQFESGMYSGIYYYEPGTSFNLSVKLSPEAEIPAVVNVDVSAFHAEIDEDEIAITDDEQNAVLSVAKNGNVRIAGDVQDMNGANRYVALSGLSFQAVDTHNSVSVPAQGNSYKTGTATKAGYYPLGIVGTYSSHYRCPFAYARLTSRASGSCNWAVNIGNWYSSAQTISAKIEILWVKE